MPSWIKTTTTSSESRNQQVMRKSKGPIRSSRWNIILIGPNETRKQKINSKNQMKPIRPLEIRKNELTMTNSDQRKGVHSLEWDEILLAQDRVDEVMVDYEDSKIYFLLSDEEIEENPPLKDSSSISVISSEIQDEGEELRTNRVIRLMRRKKKISPSPRLLRFHFLISSSILRSQFALYTGKISPWKWKQEPSQELGSRSQENDEPLDERQEICMSSWKQRCRRLHWIQRSRKWSKRSDIKYSNVSMKQEALRISPSSYLLLPIC